MHARTAFFQGKKSVEPTLRGKKLRPTRFSRLGQCTKTAGDFQRLPAWIERGAPEVRNLASRPAAGILRGARHEAPVFAPAHGLLKTLLKVWFFAGLLTGSC